MDVVTEATAAILAGAAADELESETLEFKTEVDSAKRSIDLVADAVVCLANHRGGPVIVGIADDLRGADAIQGVSTAFTPHIVVQGIFSRTRPPLSVPVVEHEIRGRTVLEVTVPRGATFYANAKGTSTRRVGTACMPFPPNEQRRAMASRGLYDWSAEPSGSRRVSDEEIARVRRLLRTAGRTELAAQAPEGILSDLRLDTADGELTRAGLLLVGEADDIAQVCPCTGTPSSTAPRPASRRKRASGSIAPFWQPSSD